MAVEPSPRTSVAATGRLRSARSSPACAGEIFRRRPRSALTADTVARPRLVARLAGSAAPLALIVAPAGFGKSTLLTQWAQSDPRPFAWLPAVEALNDPAILAAAVDAGLRVSGTDVPVVLAIDDAQTLRAPAALAMLEALTTLLPEGSVVALASRSEPCLPSGRLRAERALLELRHGDLAMTDREAATLLAHADPGLGAAEIATLARRAEGWPAALGLAAISLREAADAATAAASFHGGNRIVGDYVQDVLLADLTEQDRTVLVRCSPLETLSGPLCDAVLGTTGTGAALRRMARAGMPLFALDGAEERYRPHGLLTGVLRAELARTAPSLEAQAHRRAGTWHEATGDHRAALAEALDAGDAARAGALLWRCLPGRSPDLGPVRPVLQRFGPARIGAHAELALAAAADHALAGERDEAEHYLRAARGDLPAALATGAATVRALVALRGVAQMGRDAALAHRPADDDDPWRPVAGHLAGVALHLLGHEREARAPLEDGARRVPGAWAPARVLCQAQLTLMALTADDGAHAEELTERLARELRMGPPRDEPITALAHAVCAFGLAHAGQSREARERASTARRLALGLRDDVPWYRAELELALARADLRLSDAAAARTALGSAGRALRHEPDRLVLHDWIDDGWSRADTFAARRAGLPSVLTTAELRVLRFLPSHLSFREIGERLHVSSNTVKTQAHAAYRKLDVTSRSAAVARAREIGLVDAH